MERTDKNVLNLGVAGKCGIVTFAPVLAEPSMAVTFHTADVSFRLGQQRKLRRFLTWQVLKECGVSPRTLSFVFCSDSYLLELNKTYLGHDYFTDILTFSLSDGVEGLSGEIYISLDRVKENAEKFVEQAKYKTKDLRFSRELHRVIFHGVLHLLGYKDKRKEEQEEMRKQEEKWLKGFEEFI